MNLCESCIHWQGTEHSYAAYCPVNNCKTAFNDTCREYRPIKLTVKAGENLEQKVRDYNGMRMFTNGMTVEDLL